MLRLFPTGTLRRMGTRERLKAWQLLGIELSRAELTSVVVLSGAAQAAYNRSCGVTQSGQLGAPLHVKSLQELSTLECCDFCLGEIEVLVWHERAGRDPEQEHPWWLEGEVDWSETVQEQVAEELRMGDVHGWNWERVKSGCELVVRAEAEAREISAGSLEAAVLVSAARAALEELKGEHRKRSEEWWGEAVDAGVRSRSRRVLEQLPLGARSLGLAEELVRSSLEGPEVLVLLDAQDMQRGAAAMMLTRAEVVVPSGGETLLMVTRRDWFVLESHVEFREVGPGQLGDDREVLETAMQLRRDGMRDLGKALEMARALR